MKKLFLLFAAGVVAFNAGAQERPVSIGPSPVSNTPTVNHNEMHNMLSRPSLGARKATTGGDRWYNYADWLHRDCAYNMSFGWTPDSVVTVAPYMWNDDKSMDIYSGTPPLDTNFFVSMGVVLDPTFKGFNNGKYYAAGEMVVTSSDAYVVDSVIVQGAYGYNYNKYVSGVRDTIIISLVHSTLGSFSSSDVWTQTLGSGTHWAPSSSLTMANIHYDSVYNRANAKFGTKEVRKIVIDTNDKSSNGGYFKQIGLADAAYQCGVGSSTLSCGAGELVGWSISFKSGDAAFVPYDTVFRGSGSSLPLYKYSMLRPFTDYLSIGGSSTEWAYYWPTNVGLYKTLPDTSHGWGKKYVPEYAWFGTSGGSAQYQSPYMWTHITCASCASVVDNGYLQTKNVPTEFMTLKTYPNPVTDVLNVQYALTNKTDMTLVLHNILGQQVEVQHFSNTSEGVATFNTSHLPSGMYTVSLQTNDQCVTGRVQVVH